MLRKMLIDAVKLPFRVARLAYRSVRGQKPPESPTPEATRGSSPPSAEPQPKAPSAAPQGPSPRDVQISPEEIFEMRARGEKVIFVDVREPMETTGGIVAGAILMPSGQVGSRYEELEKDAHIVLYCASGMRSTNAALFLHGKGFSKPRSLVGGFAHWVRDNGEVAKPG